ncbi:hypothetical protein L3Q82_001102 [Scortum barcoo]|uniref:Uncharacterized protein n=1 Tax=Scortum barcoo TaxID=214431 RepID=A0ACB8WAP5_9TELE|nr:hypothetical protein L3Q82_001102 [Scortum barcoo]
MLTACGWTPRGTAQRSCCCGELEICGRGKEFVAVRVQDPRVQNEGSWNSYVDYKIFLHTNSKAFTAKTSCVRRRYSEFVWLKKKLQKNSGLVPVPDLPGKSFFSFNNDDFLEGRRKGLQAFLDKVVHMTVCLSDSQLHLFLQTQLPVGHIQDCVQGHTPYTVTDAILTYASSNRGLAQAQEDDPIKEPSLTISYESMESPAPHQPYLQAKESFSPELVACSNSDPLDSLLQLCDKDTVGLQHKDKSSLRILQRNNQLEAVVEDRGPAEATFFLGDGQDDPDSLSPAGQTQQTSCQIQTPVEVHSPVGTGLEENSRPVYKVLENESVMTVDPEEKDDQLESFEEVTIEKVNSETETCVNSVAILDLKESGLQKDVLENVCSEKQVLGNGVNGLEEVCSTEGHREERRSHSSQKRLTVTLFNKLDQKQGEQESELVGTKDESDEDSHSLPSSNGSIVQVSDEESFCDDTEDSIQAANGFMKNEEVTHNILDLHMNGCPVEREYISVVEAEDLRYTTNISEFGRSLDFNSAVSGDRDLTENSDFSILETSRGPGLADSKCPEQDALPSLSLDASEESHEVEHPERCNAMAGAKNRRISAHCGSMIGQVV